MTTDAEREAFAWTWEWFVGGLWEREFSKGKPDLERWRDPTRCLTPLYEQDMNASPPDPKPEPVADDLVDDLVVRLRVQPWQMGSNDDDRRTRVIKEREEALARITSDAATIAGLRAEIERLRDDPPSAGWLFTNPDTGVEFSEQHPVESGEVPDAIGIRSATTEALRLEVFSAWAVIAAKDAEIERLTHEADGEFVRAATDVMQEYPGFDARDYEFDGISADDFKLFFAEDMAEAWRQTQAAEARITELQAEVERLRDYITYADATAALRGEGIYIASKSAHGERWRDLRATGVPVISTWIDESEAGATIDWRSLWTRCTVEAARCRALIVYREPGETLKGAWVEVGAALAAGRPVYAVGIEDFSVRHHPGITTCRDMDTALAAALSTPSKEG